jgi:hypothetical protein
VHPTHHGDNQVIALRPADDHRVLVHHQIMPDQRQYLWRRPHLRRSGSFTRRCHAGRPQHAAQHDRPPWGRGWIRQQAQAICGVAMDIKISQRVDVPSFLVSALSRSTSSPPESMHP